MSPFVTVIIVTYNATKYIEDCLVSLEKQKFTDFDVVLLDNFSSDDTLSIVNHIKPRLRFPLKVIACKENLGFAGGNVRAREQASGTHLALLNPDTVVDPSWLRELTSAMASHPDAGIFASKMIVYGQGIIDTAGDGLSTYLRGIKRGEGQSQELYNEKEYVFGACAGAVLYRNEMLREIGFLDPDFFLIHEDTDINFRAQLQGWRALYVPGALVQHKVSSSIGRLSDTSLYYNIRNTTYVKIKNVPLSLFARHCYLLFPMTLTEFYYFAIKHRRPGLYLKAIIDVLRNLPALLSKRRKIMKARKASYRYLNGIFTPAMNRALLRSKLRKLFSRNG